MNTPQNQQARDEKIRLLTGSVAAGSELAFTDLYEMIFPQLYRSVLMQAGGNEEMCKEVVQAALLKVVRYMQPFANERVFWAWLRQVARSCHVDLLRRSSREPAQVALELADRAWAQESNENAEETELLKVLEQSMAELQPTERQLLQMAYFQHASHREIAAKLQTTPKAVESKLARTREKIRALMVSALRHYVLL